MKIIFRRFLGEKEKENCENENRIRIEDEDRSRKRKEKWTVETVLTTASIGSQVISAPMQKGKSIADTLRQIRTTDVISSSFIAR